MSTISFEWDNQTYVDCRSNSEPTAMAMFSISAFAVNFVVPLLIQTYCYASIGRRIRESRKTIADSGQRFRRSSSIDEERVKVCLTVIIRLLSLIGSIGRTDHPNDDRSGDRVHSLLAPNQDLYASALRLASNVRIDGRLLLLSLCRHLFLLPLVCRALLPLY